MVRAMISFCRTNRAVTPPPVAREAPIPELIYNREDATYNDDDDDDDRWVY